MEEILFSEPKKERTLLMKSILNSISKKHLLIYFAIGAVCAIGHMILKANSLPLTRISDGLFAGFVIPACVGAFYWMKDEKKASITPFAVAALFLAASVVFMAIAMLIN